MGACLQCELRDWLLGSWDCEVVSEGLGTEWLLSSWIRLTGVTTSVWYNSSMSISYYLASLNKQSCSLWLQLFNLRQIPIKSPKR